MSTRSEKDLEKLLAAYARHSHSSAVLFGTNAATQVPTRPLNGTTSSQDLTKDYSQTSTTARDPRHSMKTPRLPRSAKHALSRHAMSRVLQRQSRVPNVPSIASHQGSHSSTATTGRTTADSTIGVQRTAVDMPVSPPPYDTAKYSEELLRASSLPPSQKHSLCILTQSLAAGRRLSERGRKVVAPSGSGGLPPRGPDRGMRGHSVTREGKREGNGGMKSGRLLRRTLSSQSLQSNSSEASGKESIACVSSYSIYRHCILLETSTYTCIYILSIMQCNLSSLPSLLMFNYNPVSIGLQTIVLY